jgi:hypothetical protein
MGNVPVCQVGIPLMRVIPIQTMFALITLAIKAILESTLSFRHRDSTCRSTT